MTRGWQEWREVTGSQLEERGSGVPQQCVTRGHAYMSYTEQRTGREELVDSKQRKGQERLTVLFYLSG